MSSIIDDQSFEPSLSIDHRPSGHSEDLLQLMGKIGKVNEESIFLQKNQSVVETVNKFKFQSEEFCVRTTGFKAGPYIQTLVSLLDDHQYWCCSSRQNQILLMKQLVKRQKECTPESNIFFFNGRLSLILNHFLVVPISSSVRWVTAYQKIVIKNVLHLEEFINKNLAIGKKYRIPPEEFSDLQGSLLISQILNTTQTTQQILQEKSEYKFAKQSFEKQNEELTFVEKNIVFSQQFERNVKLLFVNFPQFIQSSCLKLGLLNIYQKNSKMLKSLLNVKYPAKKKIDDYVYNKVKAVVIEDSCNGRLVGEGGSCLINEYRMNVCFIDSADNQMHTNDQWVEKIVAVKKLKPNAKNDKIMHEKAIFSKLRSSVSPFFPKYYEIDKPELKSCIFMEKIVGKQLDYYLKVNSETISFWSKLYIMINVIYGVRHLIDYGIVHLDLKPINIMVCKSLIAKIIDFGEAYHPDVCPKNYIPAVTFPYAAPEVYLYYLGHSHQSSFQYSEKQDVFALGVIMSEVFFASQIFYFSHSKFKQVYATQNLLQRLFYAVERNELYGDDLLLSIIGFLIVKCLDPDPRRRPRVEWVGIILKLMLNSYVNIS